MNDKPKHPNGVMQIGNNVNLFTPSTNLLCQKCHRERATINGLCDDCTMGTNGGRLNILGDDCSCQKCGYTWKPRTDKKPKSCPNCKSYTWHKKKEGEK